MVFDIEITSKDQVLANAKLICLALVAGLAHPCLCDKEPGFSRHFHSNLEILTKMRAMPFVS